ncbi:MAG: hypothetical protein JWM68_3401, partial [Verrucomicrobiales bacterium]|nr:hypothetical protein [Verrucomicrobiales bacterium]
RPDDMHYPSYFVVISTILGKGATPQEGLHWLQRAADQGYAGAQLDLAYIYLNGIGVKKDLAQSVKWKRMAADLGGAQGRFELALSYAQGIGEPRDAEDTPTRLLLKAAAQGHVEAIATMAVRYRTGYAVEQDFIESARLHLQAATKGINKLERFMDRDGTVRAQTDPALKQFAEALKLGMQALDKGDGMAALKLGSSYVEGTRSPKNSERAYAWLNLAAQNGSSEAAGLRDKIKASLGESELKNAEKRFLELKTLALDLGK